MIRFLGALVFAGVLAAAPDGLHREGPYWVDTSTGTEPAPAGASLTVTCLGNVTVRGGAHTQLRYTLTRRLRAKSEVEARVRLNEAGVDLTRKGRALRLEVDSETGPIDLDITVPRGLTGLVVNTAGGAVEVSDLDGFVAAESLAGKVTIARVKGAVELRSAGGAVRLAEIGGNATASSAGGDIIAETVHGFADFQTAGNISIQRAGLGMRAQTAGGKISIGSSGGPVSISSMGGALDIGVIRGRVTARNVGGGPIQIGGADGISCDNAGGVIRISGATGGVRASTALGSIVAEISAAKAFADSFLSTAAGDITISLPSNLHVTVRAQNDGARNGRGIISEFPGLRIRNAGLSVTADGLLNGGGPELRIEGNGGVIWIKRK